MPLPNLTQSVIYLLLRVAIVYALFSGGAAIYNRLPSGGSMLKLGTTAQKRTVVTIIINLASARLNILQNGRLHGSVELFPFDPVIARQNYEVTKRPGSTLNDYLSKYAAPLTRIETKFDPSGRATLLAPSGKWWVHAVYVGDVELIWNLPAYIYGRQQIIELTLDNAYIRAKNF